MKRTLSLVLAIFFTLPLYAQEPILRVGVARFDPPFVMQAGNKQVIGFDINVMQAICKEINRTCQFTIIPFKDLLQAVQTQTVDVAVSSITITPERAALVNFSLPYLYSYSIFLGKKELAAQPFQLASLKDYKIGVKEGTYLLDFINEMNLENHKIVKFADLNSQIKALNNGSIDLAFLDEPTARYWQIESSGSLVTLGKPITTGFGFGIAVNKDEVDLLQEINKAVLKFINTEDYKENYNRYIGRF